MGRKVQQVIINTDHKYMHLWFSKYYKTHLQTQKLVPKVNLWTNKISVKVHVYLLQVGRKV